MAEGPGPQGGPPGSMGETDFNQDSFKEEIDAVQNDQPDDGTDFTCWYQFLQRMSAYPAQAGPEAHDDPEKPYDDRGITTDDDSISNGLAYLAWAVEDIETPDGGTWDEHELIEVAGYIAGREEIGCENIFKFLRYLNYGSVDLSGDEELNNALNNMAWTLHF